MANNPRLVEAINTLLEYAKTNTPLPVVDRIEITIDQTEETRILVKRDGATQFELVDDDGQWQLNVPDAVRLCGEASFVDMSVFASATIRRYFHRPNRSGHSGTRYLD